MKPLDQLKFTILVIGIAIWAWGARSGHKSFMFVGIGFVIIAWLLRFLPASWFHRGDSDDHTE